MSVKVKIRRLEEAGVTEMLIVATLAAELNPEHPFMHVRGKLRKPPEQLSKGARQEIYKLTSYEFSVPELARKYRTTEAQASTAKYVATTRKNRPAATLVIEAYKRLGTIIETVQELETSQRHVMQVLRAAGMTSLASVTDTELVLRLLSAGTTHQEISDATGTNISKVGRIARANGYGRQKQRKNNAVNWPEILEYARTHNVSQAAVHYNVERSNIYYQRNKQS